MELLDCLGIRWVSAWVSEGFREVSEKFYGFEQGFLEFLKIS